MNYNLLILTALDFCNNLSSMSIEAFKYTSPRSPDINRIPTKPPADRFAGTFLAHIRYAAKEAFRTTKRVASVIFDPTIPPLVTDLDLNGKPVSPSNGLQENSINDKLVSIFLRSNSSETVMDLGYYDDLFLKARLNGGIISAGSVTDSERIALENAGGHLDESGKVIIIEQLANQSTTTKPANDAKHIRSIYEQACRNAGIISSKNLNLPEIELLLTLGAKIDSSGEVIIFESLANKRI